MVARNDAVQKIQKERRIRRLKHFYLTMLCSLLLMASFAFGQNRYAVTQTITSSGQNVLIPNYIGGINASFEELINGSGMPATITIVVNGCKNGKTCAVLDT